MLYKNIVSFLSIAPFFMTKGILNNTTNNIINSGVDVLNLSLQSSMILTLLSFIPACLLMMTCFTRIILVFSFLRTALGTPYSPPNQVLIGLSLFLTFFIMSPVLDKIYNKAIIPFYKNEINISIALTNAIKPLRHFMTQQTRKSDISAFLRLAKISQIKSVENIPIQVLLPAFVISELKTAFLIGFTIFLPFAIVDLVVASILMSLGMMMVPPSTISLPLKLILFVLSDGWKLLIISLSKSFFI
ncbi:Flagellar biosynthetic protein FliP [Buchnera aphidicola (Cinara pseudotaxifoliae)]|uniref:Flagellar biosynthetic protein FliP n=1 Tax=Buchnera aphidicola (Cinara pseudotaxifoliae) TaxID=655384 RepID=A0A451DG81_9GAMM|nr:flagellar type III secretion system pore protein FliP [Buchnera aphidicola]VFP85632.1 Flagellar biosynthetic protein FliP [Buchnera aphidicola (Cinara pseudotaxifoliae)]